MRQAVMMAPGRIEFRDVARPAIADDQVLIQVRRIGICGSDIHLFHGQHPYTSYPVVQGHEVAGVVEEVGSQVEGLAQGDSVTFMPQITCSRCYPCTHGQAHICESLRVMGFQAPGAAQEFLPVTADQVLKVPAHVPLDQAALVEPVAVAVHALARAEGDDKARGCWCWAPVPSATWWPRWRGPLARRC